VPSKNPAQRLTDIVENIDAIEEFMEGFCYEDFRKDRKTVYAVIRALEIISEASRRLPAELHLRHTSIDWVAVAAAGNVYRHEYDAVDEMLIWNTAQDGLAELRRIAALELALFGQLPH
jgi:uncharacterized protein with HEPN domain